VVHLNYNHLHYFWVVATVGSIARAAASLHVTPQTISGQIRQLEARVGAALFQRLGRKLELTEVGRHIHSYADPMFRLGVELGEVLRKRAPRRPSALSVGLATGLGKSIASRILGPALDLSARTRMLCHETPHELLASALLARDIDLAVTDVAVASTHSVRVLSHLVGQCGLTFLCKRALAQRYRCRFPASLDGAPLVMPARSSMAAAALVEWFRVQQIRPSIVAEIESPELASLVCETHGALFVQPSAVADEVELKYGVASIGEVPGIEQHYYVACLEHVARYEEISGLLASARERFKGAARATRGSPDRALESWLERRVLPDSVGTVRAAVPGRRLEVDSVESQ
jgi:LysR family transcriptional activator of nhaA